jgi:hypothetical protein
LQASGQQRAQLPEVFCAATKARPTGGAQCAGCQLRQLAAAARSTCPRCAAAGPAGSAPAHTPTSADQPQRLWVAGLQSTVKTGWPQHAIGVCTCSAGEPASLPDPNILARNCGTGCTCANFRSRAPSSSSHKLTGWQLASRLNARYTPCSATGQRHTLIAQLHMSQHITLLDDHLSEAVRCLPYLYSVQLQWRLALQDCQ